VCFGGRVDEDSNAPDHRVAVLMADTQHVDERLDPLAQADALSLRRFAGLPGFKSSAGLRKFKLFLSHCRMQGSDGLRHLLDQHDALGARRLADDLKHPLAVGLEHDHA